VDRSELSFQEHHQDREIDGPITLRGQNIFFVSGTQSKPQFWRKDTWRIVVNCGAKSGLPSNHLWPHPQSHGHMIASSMVTSTKDRGRS
jgi:hypothetical protein